VQKFTFSKLVASFSLLGSEILLLKRISTTIFFSSRLSLSHRFQKKNEIKLVWNLDNHTPRKLSISKKKPKKNKQKKKGIKQKQLV